MTADVSTYLRRHVFPDLEQAIAHVLRAGLREQLKLASGSQWLEGPYLPPGWTPPQVRIAQEHVGRHLGYVVASVTKSSWSLVVIDCDSMLDEFQGFRLATTVRPESCSKCSEAAS